MNNSPRGSAQSLMLLDHLSPDRLSTYVARCQGDLDRAVALYDWNSNISGALWESLGQVEVVLRNTMATGLSQRHARLQRFGSWLDDPAHELDPRATRDIIDARARLRSKGKSASEGQIISELNFGFWRFLISRRYQTTLWPGLAGGFQHAPNRAIRTVEDPVRRLHELRNRIAHHQRVWNHDLPGRYADMLSLLGYIDPAVQTWASETSRVPISLANRPANT